VNMGECVASLRTLLHRHSLYQFLASNDSGINATGGLLYTTLRRFPAVPGYNPNAPFFGTKVVAASGTAPFVFTRMTPLAWVTYAYCGHRGSYNWAFALDSLGNNLCDNIIVSRSSDTTNKQVLFASNNATGSALVKSAGLNGYASASPGWYDGSSIIGGGALTSSRINNVIMANVPNYNKNNFARAVPAESLYGSTEDDTNADSIIFRAYYTRGTPATNNTMLSLYVGAGPDYNPVFFLCCPTIDYLLVSITSS
jgi:hypothetical protein